MIKTNQHVKLNRKPKQYILIENSNRQTESNQQIVKANQQINQNQLNSTNRVECWLRVREVPGSIPSQGPRHTKDVIKMVPVVPLFGTQH